MADGIDPFVQALEVTHPELSADERRALAAALATGLQKALAWQMDPATVQFIPRCSEPKGNKKVTGIGPLLQQLRHTAGLTQQNAVVAPGWSQSKITRIERERTVVTVEDARALLAIYEVTDQAVIDHAVALVKQQHAIRAEIRAAKLGPRRT